MPLKSPSDYSSIPTSTTPILPKQPRHPPPPTTTFMSRARAQISTRRPWREFFDISAISLPYSYNESLPRIRRNINYFSINYALVMLFLLFCSLIYHPISMIVFLILFVLWMLFVFFRDGPVIVFGRIISDRVVMVSLWVITIVALAFTEVGSNVFLALLVGVVVVGFHAAFRGIEGLFLDEDEAVDEGLVSVVGGSR